MPRVELFYINGEPVDSINVVLGAGQRERNAAIAAGAEHVEEQKRLDEDARRPFDRRVVPEVKAGTYVSAWALGPPTTPARDLKPLFAVGLYLPSDARQ